MASFLHFCLLLYFATQRHLVSCRNLCPLKYCFVWGSSFTHTAGSVVSWGTTPIILYFVFHIYGTNHITLHHTPSAAPGNKSATITWICIHQSSWFLKHIVRCCLFKWLVMAITCFGCNFHCFAFHNCIYSTRKGILCVAKYSKLECLVPLILWWIFPSRRYCAYSQQSPSCETKIDSKVIEVEELLLLVVVVVCP